MPQATIGPGIVLNPPAVPRVDSQFGRFRCVISWIAVAQLSASMVLAASLHESLLITGLSGTPVTRAL
jgi:hypothetical protein